MSGAHVTVGSTGVRRTVGIPGTGIYYTSHSGLHSGVHSAHVENPISNSQQAGAHTIAQLILAGCVVAFIVLVVALVGK